MYIELCYEVFDFFLLFYVLYMEWTDDVAMVYNNRVCESVNEEEEEKHKISYKLVEQNRKKNCI